MRHFYRNVPKLGNVAVSSHAQDNMSRENISSELFEKVLLKPIESDIPDGFDIVFRERYGIRLVIETNPTPNRGAKIIKTVFRIQAQASARR